MSAEQVPGRRPAKPTPFKLFVPQPIAEPPQTSPISAPIPDERQRTMNPLASFGQRIAQQFADRTVTEDDRWRAMNEMTMDSFYREFMLPERQELVKKAKLDPKTLRLDSDALTWLTRYGIPDDWDAFTPWNGPPIGCFTTAWLDTLVEETLLSGISISTIGKYLRHLRTMLNKAASLQLISKLKVNIPTEAPEARPFTDAEVEKIYWALGEHPALQVAFVLAIATGARFGDLFWLKWEQIDFEKRQIDFTAEKTEKRQIVPLTDIPIKHLNRLPRTEPPFASLIDISLDPAWRGSNYWSKRMNIRWRCLTGFEAPPRLKKDRPADCVPHPWHSARSTAGVWIERVKSGMASLLLGHTIEKEGEKTTRRHYLVPMVPQDLREAAEAIEWPTYFESINGPRQRRLF